MLLVQCLGESAWSEVREPGRFRDVARNWAPEAPVVVQWGLFARGCRGENVMPAWRAETDLAMALPRLPAPRVLDCGNIPQIPNSRSRRSFEETQPRLFSLGVSCRHAVGHTRLLGSHFPLCFPPEPRSV